MKERLFITPQYTNAQEIKRIRTTLGLTQKEFAILVNCSKATIERWETAKEPISGSICLILKMLEKYPEYVTNIKVPKKISPIRLWYMYKETVCTIIDVNEMKREVFITNYTDNLMFRAFGVNEKPNYEAYMDFLEYS